MTIVISPETLVAEEVLIGNVTRGAEWLDEINPKWYLNIDIGYLDLSDSSSCICGQIFCEDALTLANEDDDGYIHYFENGYEYALSKFFDNKEIEAIAHGFQAVTNYSAREIRYYKGEEVDLNKILESPFYNRPAHQYEFLAWEWIRQINLRLQSYQER
jgi:hypothetical protein